MTGKQYMVSWIDDSGKEHKNIYESYDQAKRSYEKHKQSMPYNVRKTLQLCSRIVTSWQEVKED